MTLKPEFGVKMTAVKKGKDIEVTFSHIGDEPFGLVLPKEAKDSFQNDKGMDLSYKTPPTKTLLTPSTPPLQPQQPHQPHQPH